MQHIATQNLSRCKCGRKNADFLKVAAKHLKMNKKMTKSGGQTSKFGQNLVEVTGLEPAASSSQN